MGSLANSYNKTEDHQKKILAKKDHGQEEKTKTDRDIRYRALDQNFFPTIPILNFTDPINFHHFPILDLSERLGFFSSVFSQEDPIIQLH